jgi:lipopolysaccharide/colanic/teichoic acid biosynthesis glycosyltransferase
MIESEINWEVVILIFEYIEARRHEMKSRITGWAQMNDRNASFICNFGFEMVM